MTLSDAPRLPAAQVVERLRAARSAFFPPALAFMAFVIGLLSIVSAIMPGARRPLQGFQDLLPLPAAGAITAMTVALGSALILIAHGLARAKRQAWTMAFVGATALALLHLLRGPDLDSAIAATVLVGVLLIARAAFTARSDRTNRRHVITAVLAIYGIGLGVGMSVFKLWAGHLTAPASVAARLQTVLMDFVGLTGPVHFRRPAADLISGEIIGGFSVLALIVGSYLLLRAAEPAPYRDETDLAQLRGLLDRHGERDSLGYFSLRDDKSVVFSPTGKAAITYRVIAGVALISGDPLGDPEAWPGAIDPFLRLCRDNAWVPSVLGCSATAASTFARHGLKVLELGDEAVVDPRTFSLSGRSMRNVRQMVNRVYRAGYTAQVRRIGDLSTAEQAELQRSADKWRGSAKERGFSMALGRLGDADCVVATAHTIDADGVPRLRAVQQFVPWGECGLSLDLMRRDGDADPGMNEFLITTLLAQAGSMGITGVSLNFAMFRNAFAAGERLGAGPLARMWAAVLRFASRWWQLESLYRFNAKFDPQWVPRYVCYRRASSLPRIGYAAMEAEAFISRIAPLRVLIGRTIVDHGQVVTRPRQRIGVIGHAA